MVNANGQLDGQYMTAAAIMSSCHWMLLRLALTPALKCLDVISVAESSCLRWECQQWFMTYLWWTTLMIDGAQLYRYCRSKCR